MRQFVLSFGRPCVQAFLRQRRVATPLALRGKQPLESTGWPHRAASCLLRLGRDSPARVAPRVVLCGTWVWSISRLATGIDPRHMNIIFPNFPNIVEFDVLGNFRNFIEFDVLVYPLDFRVAPCRSGAAYAAAPMAPAAAAAAAAAPRAARRALTPQLYEFRFSRL